MIAILDYGSGNLRSAQRAFETTGQKVVVTSDYDLALSADGLVVPGVGAFAACMDGLQSIRGDQIIRERVAGNRKVFGICIGMQILFAHGTENGNHSGVGIWDATVEKLSAPILPHMGWNTVHAPSGSALFQGVSNEFFYFVHSYAAKNSSSGEVAFAEYGDRFVAAIEDGPVTATQFHPEKSGGAGLALIKNWSNSL